MRIIYVVPGPMGRTPEGAEELARRGGVLREFAAPGTEVDIIDVPRGPASIESMYEEYISIPATAERILEAEENGYDAAIVGCFGDPGLDAFRELTEMLVVGPGEASFLAAAMLGHSFSVVTVTASVIASTKREVRNAGVGDKLASVRGQPPDLIFLPPGCPFAPRCDYATERCERENPPLEAVGVGHKVACWEKDKTEGIKSYVRE